MKPLADKIRPEKIEDFVGQSHLIGKNKIISSIIKSKKIPNMIIYGPPGTGKTSLANILSKQCNKSFYKLNGTTTNTDQIKQIIKETYNLSEHNGIILFIDELHFLSKKQQQIILEFIENGYITLIGSTTENINFSIVDSIISRCILINFKPLTSSDIKNKLINVIDENFKDYEFNEESIKYIANISNGDLRKALNILELCTITFNPNISITMDKIESLSQSTVNLSIKNKDNLYNNLSYLQKSIRGSDPNAASIALSLLIESGDLNSICRRLLVIASEDIGLAYPQAISIVKSCIDSAIMLGFPEAKIPLSQATILLATSPKSNTAYLAINRALEDVKKNQIEIPSYLCSNYSNNKINEKTKYLYPHDYPNNYIKQDYLPHKLKDKIYYNYGNNKFEQSIKNFWQKIK